jgi:hypothetical protein
MTERLEPRATPAAKVLDQLDACAAQSDSTRQQAGGAESRRSRNRRPFRTPCKVWYLPPGAEKPPAQDAWTRNLSERGIGFLAKAAVPIGNAVEVQITPPNHRPTHLAGVVVFCRPTAQGYHEIGVELKVRQDTPVFAHDPAAAVATWAWLKDAMRYVQGGGPGA